MDTRQSLSESRLDASLPRAQNRPSIENYHRICPPSGCLNLMDLAAGKFSTISLQAQSPFVSTFISNLRLLDLDKREDWPGITAQILSSKDAQQHQKKRIQCVEWALYRLFEIFDKEETRSVGTSPSF